MQKKIYILKTFILCLGIIASFFPLFSSYRPAGKRPLGYTGPMPIRSIPQGPIINPIQEQQTIDVSREETPKKEPEELESKLEQASDMKEAQKDLPRPNTGFFASMYATIVPIILITLDKAIGTGTAASTKNLIKEFTIRRTFINLKNSIIEEATEIVNKGDFDKNIESHFQNSIEKNNISKENRAFYQLRQEAMSMKALPLKDKIELQTKILFDQNKIDDPEKLEKQTSFPSIFAQAAYVGILNVAVNTIGTLFGYATKIGLNALMPDQNNHSY